MVGICLRSSMRLCAGTWAMRAFMRALGAKIGRHSRLRVSYCVPHLPDCLTLGDGVHFGDFAAMPGSILLDGERVWTGPIRLSDQCLVGASAVVLPGCTLGRGAILAAGSAAELGATLAGVCCCRCWGPQLPP